MKRNLILLPYANLASVKGGVNIHNEQERTDVYLKNCCTACASARRHCGENTDVALATNIDVPEKYRAVLEQFGIKMLRYDFDQFHFGEGCEWGLAFYKLCALSHALNETDYAAYAFLDTDVYVQHSFDDIWRECGQHLLLYDICHGLQVRDYRGFLSEVAQFTGENALITHYGGEFFAAGKADAEAFMKECLTVFESMRRREFRTTFGDEFITSLAAARMGGRVKNAGAYVFRFWTGRFRLVSTCYASNAVAVLHVPAEKEAGMLKIYDKYIKKGHLPKPAAVWSLLHLRHRRFAIACYEMACSLIGRKN